MSFSSYDVFILKKPHRPFQDSEADRFYCCSSQGEGSPRVLVYVVNEAHREPVATTSFVVIRIQVTFGEE